MKYLDTGSRDPSHALATWLKHIVSESVIELRLQTGFFSFDSTGLLVQTMQKANADDRISNVLIGSNDGCTLKADVALLKDLLGVPRKNARLGVVSFSGAYFHPKTYHVLRDDGSQAAFVGSANLTPSGLAVHVEAGIALDTREGDPPKLLAQIAQAIDSWFIEQRPGLTVIASEMAISTWRVPGFSDTTLS